ncbi:carboxypeptidase-like regulatory domain-containing protein [Flavobacterium sp.]|uniref:carboxypeptidase-like regulatory domain-containing protein n=1 Tax=Flavobacterium sp. TaxID=239 RepID=UPI00122342D8|nr:carboxypeptidase-like regulatory domain-containing protein [Flavobacterium sp.]RZJ72391.1 MAG: carboxypeptidase regulatory-like domain-containing protein [Flavobacterium sp.]
MRKLLLILCCFPLLMAATCEDNDDNAFLDDNCTEEAVAGLNVQVKDAATGEFLSDVVITAQDGAYGEILELVPASNPATYVGAWERTGTYVLTIQKDGYQSFISNGFQVTENVCHVNPQNLTFEISPL